MNCIYSKLECEANFRQDTPERRAFARHLKLVAKALRDIERVDSADYGPGDVNAAIRACLGDAVMLATVLGMTKEAVATLQAEIDRAEAKR
jgi:hypothetical protein